MRCKSNGVTLARTNDPLKELETLMTGLVNYLFPGKTVRINNDYFPFTDPSIEVEVKFCNDWLEVLGGGIVHSLISKPLNINTPLLAWGIGIERLAMILFDISDIRLFWTEDKKFINQFQDGQIKNYKPYSSIEPIQRDISFWLPEKTILCTESSFEWLDINLFLEYVRESGGELVESVVLFDNFFHPYKKKYSLSFHITFSPIVSWQDGAQLVKKANETIYYLRESIATKFNVELR